MPELVVFIRQHLREGSRGKLVEPSLDLVDVRELCEGPASERSERVHPRRPVGFHGRPLDLGVLTRVALALDDQVQRVVLVQRAPTDLQSFCVTQLPGQHSAPVTDWCPLAKSEHLRDLPLQRSAAPTPGLRDIDDECIVNPLIVKPRDRDIGILSLEMSAGPGGK